jgi:hypothetical protein
MRDRDTHVPEAEERYRTLLDVIKAVAAPLDRADFFSNVASALRSAVPLDRMGIGVADAERDEFVLYSFGAEQEPANWRSGSVARTSRAISDSSRTFRSRAASWSGTTWSPAASCHWKWATSASGS